MIQGSDEWFEARLGKVTASKVGICFIKKSDSVMREKYIIQLMLERLTGMREETFCSPAMEEGKRREDEARQLYECLYNVEVQQVGLIDHPTIANFAASPDGIVQYIKPRGLEIKNPELLEHERFCRTEQIQKDYLLQMQAGMICLGLDEWDYFSYNPFFAPCPHKRITVTLDQTFDYIKDDITSAMIEQKVKDLLSEVDEKVKFWAEKGS